MSTEHTQGRLVAHLSNGKCVDLSGWRADYDESMGATQYQAIQDEAGQVVAIVVARSSDNWADLDTDSNARRLVACWNACEGVSTEMLETARITMLSILRPGEPTGPGGAVSAPIPTPLMTPAGQIEVMLAALQDIAQHSDAYGLRAKAALEKIGVAS